MSNRRERAHVSSLYNSPSWREKVRKMSDEQVIAIYLRSLQDPPKPKPRKPDNKQTRLF